jgi:modulator of FtsH protease HflC
VRTSFFGGVSAFAVLLLLLIAYMSLYVVPQTQFALPLRLGEPLAPRTAPGLYAKWPFIDNVVYIDKRILDLDAPSQEVIANDQKRLVVDAFARYRVTDPLKFYQTLGSITGAELRLTNIMNSSLRRVLGQASFLDVVRNKRGELMSRIKDELNREATGFGVVVNDVRIRRADLPEANSQAVFQRMQTERQREAAQFRAQGGEQAQRIRAEADREVARITGEANGSAEMIRGAADAERNRIFAEAYNRDPEFFDFFRSIQAYTDSLKPSLSRFLLSPDSEFFRYFRGPGTSSIKPGQTGQTLGQAPAAAPAEPAQTTGNVSAKPPAAAPVAPQAVAPVQAAPPQPQ